MWDDTDSLVCEDLNCFEKITPSPTPESKCLANPTNTPTYLVDLIKTRFNGFDSLKTNGIGYSETVTNICPKRNAIVFYENDDRILDKIQNPCKVNPGSFVWLITTDGQFSYCPVENNLQFGAKLSQCASCRKVLVGGEVCVANDVYRYNFKGDFQSLYTNNKLAIEKNMDVLWTSLADNLCTRKFTRVDDKTSLLPSTPPTASYAKKLCGGQITNPDRILWQDTSKPFCTDYSCLQESQ